MEGGSGFSAVPSASAPFDKSRVLDVKPLRSLKPVLPSNPQAPPFVCAPPFGPFPPGFSPFYPFSSPDVDQNNSPHPTQTPPASFATPIRAFRSSDVQLMDASNSDAGKEDGFIDGKKQSASSSRQERHKKRKDQDFSMSGSKDLVVGVSSFERDDGNREVVINVLMRFDALRRRLSQIEDAKESAGGLIKRADLKASNVMMSKGIRTNMRKRVGVVPGVDIGDIFFFRMEICLIGLHSQSMAGIDYMITRGDLEEEPVAVSIISSGGYDDDAEDSDILIYSGQGGNAYRKGEKASDQKLERGNLALERSLRRANEVRVIRGMKDVISPTSKVYVYDGLYKVQESWIEKGKSGCNIFKYKLVRIPGQPSAFAIWKLIQKWKDGISGRAGVILPDLSSGAESVPVALVNDVDDEKGPAYFTYFATLKYSKSFRLTKPSSGCNCRNACGPGNPYCYCIQKNGGDFPYTANGVLVSRKPLIYECGHSCPCSRDCKSRVSQTGLKVRLDVFKTKDRGWGLRSLDPIRAGTFICEYAGQVIDIARARQDMEEGNNGDYIFDATRTYDLFKWNYETGLIEDDYSNNSSEEYNIPYPLVISAKNVGNVARFMNHSCSPNVFWQPIIFEHDNESFVHIAFFAMRHIPPMTELTYDYGISQSDGGNYEPHKKKKCLCRSPKCRGVFG